MKSIPLVRPYIPAPEEWVPFYEMSRKAGQYSNFGPCEQAATVRLNEVTGKNCLLTSSGTAALQAIIKASLAGMIAIPDFTFEATRSAVFGASRGVHIAPCGFDGLPDVDYLDKNRAMFDYFVVTAPFGSDPEFERYDALAEEISRPVVYDCAGGWGLDFSRTKNPVAISFHATKNLPIGEGGAVLLDKGDSIDGCKAAINFGPGGFNGKMSEVHAAILLAQLQPHNLRVAEQRSYHRIQMLGLYCDLCPKITGSFCDGAPSLCAVTYDGDVQNLLKYLNGWRIATKRGYWPFMSLISYSDPELANTVCLPSAVTADEVRYISSKINEVDNAL